MIGKMFLRRLSSLAEPLPRITHGKYPVPNDSKYKKLMETQSLFCREDGLLVWQKTGADVVKYRVLVVGTIIGTLATVYGIVRLIVPPKNA